MTLMTRLSKCAALCVIAWPVFTAGCATASLTQFQYVPHASLPARPLSESAKQAFFESAQAVTSPETLFAVNVGGHDFSKKAFSIYCQELGFRQASEKALKESSFHLFGNHSAFDAFERSAIWQYNDRLKNALGQNAEGAGTVGAVPSPREIILRLEPRPYFSPTLIDESGLAKTVIRDAYAIRGRSEIENRFFRVGWRDATEDQLGEYYRLSGATVAYADWQEGMMTPNLGRKILLGTTALGFVGGAVAGYVYFYSGKTDSSGGFGLLLSPFILIFTGGAAALATSILALPVIYSTWDDRGEMEFDRARKEFNRYLDEQLKIGLVPTSGGAMLATQLNW